MTLTTEQANNILNTLFNEKESDRITLLKQWAEEEETHRITSFYLLLKEQLKGIQSHIDELTHERESYENADITNSKRIEHIDKQLKKLNKIKKTITFYKQWSEEAIIELDPFTTCDTMQQRLIYQLLKQLQYEE